MKRIPIWFHIFNVVSGYVLARILIHLCLIHK